MQHLHLTITSYRFIARLETEVAPATCAATAKS